MCFFGCDSGSMNILTAVDQVLDGQDRYIVRSTVTDGTASTVQVNINVTAGRNPDR